MTNWWTLQQLKFRNPEARRKAVEKLALKESPESLSQVSAMVDDPDPEVRLAVMKALAQMRNVEAVDPVLKALRDTEPGVREVAVSVLERIGNPMWIESLVPLLNDRNPAVRRRAARALVALKWRPESDTQSAKWAVTLGEHSRAAIIGSAAIEPLVAVIQDKESPDRRQAVEALSTIEDSRILAPLIAVLKDRDPHVRVAA